MELRYFRDVDLRDVDFVDTEDKQPLHFIECKKGQRSSNRALRYLKKRFPEAKATNMFFEQGSAYQDKYEIIHQPATDFLSSLI